MFLEKNAALFIEVFDIKKEEQQTTCNEMRKLSTNQQILDLEKKMRNKGQFFYAMSYNIVILIMINLGMTINIFGLD